jgi:hypothetical protein
VDASAAVDLLADLTLTRDGWCVLALRLLKYTRVLLSDTTSNAVQVRLVARGLFDKLSDGWASAQGAAFDVSRAVATAALMASETTLSAPVFEALGRVCDVCESTDAMTRAVGLHGVISIFSDSFRNRNFEWQHYNARVFERALRVVAEGWTPAVDHGLSFFTAFAAPAVTYKGRAAPYLIQIFEKGLRGKSIASLTRLLTGFEFWSNACFYLKYGGVIDELVKLAMDSAAPTHFTSSVLSTLVAMVGRGYVPLDGGLVKLFGAFVVKIVCDNSSDRVNVRLLAKSLSEIGGGSVRAALGFGHGVFAALLKVGHQLLMQEGGHGLMTASDVLLAAAACHPASKSDAPAVVEVLLQLLQPQVAVSWAKVIASLRSCPGVEDALSDVGVVGRAAEALERSGGSAALGFLFRTFAGLYPLNDANSSALRRVGALVRSSLLSPDSVVCEAALEFVRPLATSRTGLESLRKCFDVSAGDVVGALRKLFVSGNFRSVSAALGLVPSLNDAELRKALLSDAKVVESWTALAASGLSTSPVLFLQAVNAFSSVAAAPEFAAFAHMVGFSNLREAIVAAVKANSVPAYLFGSCFKLLTALAKAGKGDVGAVAELYFTHLPHLPQGSDLAKVTVLGHALSEESSGLGSGCSLSQVVAASRVLIADMPDDQPMLRLAVASSLASSFSEGEAFCPDDVGVIMRLVMGGFWTLDALRVASHVDSMLSMLQSNLFVKFLAENMYGEGCKRALMDELMAVLQARAGDLSVVPIFNFMCDAVLLPDVATSSFCRAFIAAVPELLDRWTFLVDAKLMVAMRLCVNQARIMCWFMMLANMPGHATFDKWLSTVTAIGDPRARTICVFDPQGISGHFQWDPAAVYFRKHGALLNNVIAWMGGGLLSLKMEASNALFSIVRSTDDAALVAAMDGAAEVLKLEGRYFFDSLLEFIKRRQDRLSGMFVKFPDHPLARALCEAATFDDDTVTKRLEVLSDVALFVPQGHALASMLAEAFGRVVEAGLEGKDSKTVFNVLFERTKSAAGRVGLRGQKSLEAKLRAMSVRDVAAYEEGSCKICRAAAVMAAMHAEEGWGIGRMCLLGAAGCCRF